MTSSAQKLQVKLRLSSMVSEPLLFVVCAAQRIARWESVTRIIGLTSSVFPLRRDVDVVSTTSHTHTPIYVSSALLQHSVRVRQNKVLVSGCAVVLIERYHHASTSRPVAGVPKLSATKYVRTPINQAFYNIRTMVFWIFFMLIKNLWLVATARRM